MTVNELLGERLIPPFMVGVDEIDSRTALTLKSILMQIEQMVDQTGK